jgi:ankyrin repeat protein
MLSDALERIISMGQTTFSNSKAVPIRFQSGTSGRNNSLAVSVPISNRNQFANRNSVVVGGSAQSEQPQFGAAFPVNAEPRFIDDIGGNLTRWFSGVTGGGFSLSPEAVKSAAFDSGDNLPGIPPIKIVLSVAGGLAALLASGLIGKQAGLSQAMKSGKMSGKIKEAVQSATHSTGSGGSSGGGSGGGVRTIQLPPIPQFSFLGKTKDEIIQHLNSLSSTTELENILFNPDKSSANTALHQALDETNPAQSADTVEVILEKMRGNADLLRKILFKKGDADAGKEGLKPLDLAASNPALIEALERMLTELTTVKVNPSGAPILDSSGAPIPNHSYDVLKIALSGNRSGGRNSIQSDSTVHHAARNKNPNAINALFNAVESGDLQTIRKLFSAVKDTNKTALDLAIDVNDMATFKAILTKLIDLNQFPLLTNHYGSSQNTIFHSAAKSSNPAFIKELMDLVTAHPDKLGDVADLLFAANNKGEKPFHLAAQNKDSAAALEEILNVMAGTPPHARLNEMLLDNVDSLGDTLFHKAANNLPAFQLLLTRFGADNAPFTTAMYNRRNVAGKSVYGLVIQNPDALKAFMDHDMVKNHSDMLQIVLERTRAGRNPHIPFDTHNSTAFQFAAATNPKSLQIMCDAMRAALDPAAQPTAITLPELLNIFRERNNENNNVVQMAAKQGPESLKIITNFLQELSGLGKFARPADLRALLTAANNAGDNAWHLAAKQGPESIKVFTAFLDKLLKVLARYDRGHLMTLATAQNTAGENVLHIAAEKGVEALEEVLPLLQPATETHITHTLQDSLRAVDTLGQNPFLKAVAQSAAAAKKILECAALPPNTTTPRPTLRNNIFRLTDRSGRNAAHLAADEAAFKLVIDTANELDPSGVLAQTLITHKTPATGVGGADTNIAERTPLHAAAAAGNPGKVSAIVAEAKKDPTGVVLRKLLEERDEFGRNALYLAQNEETAKLLFATANELDPGRALTQTLITARDTSLRAWSGFQNALVNKPAVARIIFEEAKKHRPTFDILLGETYRDSWAQRNVFHLANQDPGMTQLLLDEIQPESQRLTAKMAALVGQTTVNPVRNTDIANKTILHDASPAVMSLIMERLKKVGDGPAALERLLGLRDIRRNNVGATIDTRTVLQRVVMPGTANLDKLKAILAVVQDNPALLGMLLQQSTAARATVLDLAAQRDQGSVDAILKSIGGNVPLLEAQLLTLNGGNNSFHKAILGNATGAAPGIATVADVPISMIKAAKTAPNPPAGTPSILDRLITQTNAAGLAGLHIAAGISPAFFKKILKEFSSGTLTAGNLGTHNFFKILGTETTDGNRHSVVETAVRQGQATVDVIMKELQPIEETAIVQEIEKLRANWPVGARYAQPRDANAISADSNSGAFRTSLNALTLSNPDKVKLTRAYELRYLNWLRAQ